MSNWIAEAHRDWHTATGQTYGCPWDACQPPDEWWEDEADAAEPIAPTAEEVADAVAAGFLPEPGAWEPPF